MSKKMMLIALAVAALFALPSAASAQEIHFSGVTTFSGSGPAGSLAASGEPTIACTKTTVSTGSFDSGSTTTGKLALDFTGCTAEFLGATPSCNTSGGASGTGLLSGTFHLITFVNSLNEKKPAILLTLEPPVFICAGFSNIRVTGNIIGTITSPACGGSSKALGVFFKSNGSPPTQEHELYTGNLYDLTEETGTGTPVTAGLTASVTLESSTQGTLECT